MTLASLASLQDLIDRSIDYSCVTNPQAILDSVSSAIRDAAGSAISSTTSTIQLPGTSDEWLDIPAGPVTAVGSVAIGSDQALVAGTDYTVVGDSLWRHNGWLTSSMTPPFAPVLVNITLTRGLIVVPADIVDLACSFAALAMKQSDDDMYGTQSQVQSERLGDYSITWQHGMGNQSSERNPSPVSIPEGTRQWLRNRFGPAVATTGTRR